MDIYHLLNKFRIGRRSVSRPGQWPLSDQQHTTDLPQTCLLHRDRSQATSHLETPRTGDGDGNLCRGAGVGLLVHLTLTERPHFMRSVKQSFHVRAD
ncbi:hypothetical protein BaRGS_00034130 [Batillaria attramentaria]|uniref:Uncharacterized protein n=1 Tax=Batillaria attramentaria TaxID=370345 RepID=A0ABD0JII7_9CAEN